jgi:hypothetical protein
MDLEELARVETALIAVVAEAKIILQETGRGRRFREVISHAREMHDILLEAMITSEPSVAQRVRGLSESFGNAVDELEIAEYLAHAKPHLKQS